MRGEIRIVNFFDRSGYHKSLLMFLKEEPQLGIPDEVTVYDLKSGESFNIKKVDWNAGFKPTNKDDYKVFF